MKLHDFTLSKDTNKLSMKVLKNFVTYVIIKQQDFTTSRLINKLFMAVGIITVTNVIKTTRIDRLRTHKQAAHEVVIKLLLLWADA